MAMFTPFVSHKMCVSVVSIWKREHLSKEHNKFQNCMDIYIFYLGYIIATRTSSNIYIGYACPNANVPTLISMGTKVVLNHMEHKNVLILGKCLGIHCIWRNFLG